MNYKDGTREHSIIKSAEPHQPVKKLRVRETGREHAEEALKRSETRYRRLFETAQDGILLLNADTGQILDVNPFLLKMLGYSHKDFMGKKLWEIGVTKDAKDFQEVLARLEKDGVIRDDYGILHRTDDAGRQKKTPIKQFETNLSRHRIRIR